MGVELTFLSFFATCRVFVSSAIGTRSSSHLNLTTSPHSLRYLTPVLLSLVPRLPLTVHLRLEEISRKLRTNDVVPPDGERSPSPPPIYGPDGKRANTREIRYRTKLENERHRLVERGMKLDVNFRPPGDYKRPSKMQDKVRAATTTMPSLRGEEEEDAALAIAALFCSLRSRAGGWLLPDYC